jgi:hypothetical protein
MFAGHLCGLPLLLGQSMLGLLPNLSCLVLGRHVRSQLCEGGFEGGVGQGRVLSLAVIASALTALRAHNQPKNYCVIKLNHWWERDALQLGGAFKVE